MLFLDPNKFRGDIECLNKTENFNIYSIDSRRLFLTISSFISDKIDVMDYVNYLSSNKKQTYLKINHFHEILVKNICNHFSIDCIIISNCRYVEYFPWLKAFQKRSVPIIMFYRECLLTTDRFRDGVTERNKLFRKYPFDHIIVHNDVTKKTFIESGMANDDQVTAAGALRMDSLIKMINGPKIVNKNKRKQVTLFYFDYKDSLFGKKRLSEKMETVFGNKYDYVKEIWPFRENLFNDLHSILIKLALEHPEIDVIVKCKKVQIEKSKETWQKYVEIQKKMNPLNQDLPNYIVTSEGDSHQLIMDSDFIIGLQSTAVLESALANKHVIFPLFYKYSEIKNFKDFHWHNHINLFDVAYSGNQLYEMILDYLSNEKEISSEMIEGRKKLFEKYFSNLEGKSLQKYSQIIEKVISENNEQVKTHAQA